MIHNIRRDEVHLSSGRVIWTDPIEVNTSLSREEREFWERIQPALRNANEAWMLVTMWNRMDAVYDKSPCVLFIGQVETIIPRIIQIEAGEEAFL